MGLKATVFSDGGSGESLEKENELLTEELTQSKARIRELFGDNPELEAFILKMVSEIAENKHQKGDWRTCEPGVIYWMDELRHHYNKLNGAFADDNFPAVLEFCADIANIAFFIAVNSNALSEKSDKEK